jgi:hypothetical protein
LIGVNVPNLRYLGDSRKLCSFFRPQLI